MSFISRATEPWICDTSGVRLGFTLLKERVENYPVYE